jgi:3-oxoacyl-[acyl-carrier-protein] synthase-1
LNTATLDAACGPQIRVKPAPLSSPYVLSNSFGFGGSNCVLAFGSGRRP